MTVRLRRLARVAAIAAVAAVAACSSVRSQLGLGKQSPDEFNVVTRAPLSLPPDFSLHPPTPGTQRPQEATAQALAKTALAVAVKPSTGKRAQTSGEIAILSRAGTDKARKDIRKVLNAESKIYASNDESFVDKLIFWQKKVPAGSIVDPTKESQRLKEAIALGKPATEGETATIKRRKKGLLEGLF